MLQTAQTAQTQTAETRAEALDRLMAQYGTQLLRMAYLYLRDASLAEDAVQETFLKAYRHWADFRGDSGEKSWLTRIAINVCKDINRTAWMRHVDRRRPLDSLPEAGAPASFHDDTVLNAVMALPARDKEVILLRYYQEMKVAQMGEVLGLPEPAVASRLLRAKKKLREKLEGWYFDEA